MSVYGRFVAVDVGAVVAVVGFVVVGFVVVDVAVVVGIVVFVGTVVTTLPDVTKTIVTGMHGFVGSNAEKLSVMTFKFHSFEFNDLPGLFGGEYLNSYPLFPEATRMQMSPPTGDCSRVTKAS
jgi:hypothetical protein